MKMKEVIEKTGLTDRAVRLYIDEGLALPAIEESYSGRKSIDFSESDVERLKNVALLRKAGFSIADIKSIVDDNSTAKNIIEKFIEQTETNIAHETEIVEKLKGISFDEDVTLETICSSLSETVEEKEVPSEDIKMTVKEMFGNIAAIIFALFQFVFAAFVFTFILTDILNFRFINIDIKGIGALFVHTCWLIIIISSAVIIVKNIKKFFFKQYKSIAKHLTALLLTLTVFLNVTVCPLSLILGIFGIHPFYSKTTNPDNYLTLDRTLEEFDEYGYMDSFFEVFPRNIPLSAKKKYPDSIHYFYEFHSCWDWYIGSYDFCAEWVLPSDEYEETINNLPGDFLLENSLAHISQIEKTDNMTDEMHKNHISYLTKSAIESNRYKITQKGDWTMVYYINDIRFKGEDSKTEISEKEKNYEKSGDEFAIETWVTDEYHITYDLLICAFNSKEQKVRYIASQICGHERDKDGPYYLSLDW